MTIPPAMIKCKSIYAPPHPDDGERLYVDTLWPEGITTRRAAVKSWLKELAPSYELWRHNYQLENWEDYRRQYLQELQAPGKRQLLETLRKKTAEGVVTLLYGTSDGQRNNAAIIKELLECN